jgi:hypothetical protein
MSVAKQALVSQGLSLMRLHHQPYNVPTHKDTVAQPTSGLGYRYKFWSPIRITGLCERCLIPQSHAKRTNYEVIELLTSPYVFLIITKAQVK